MSEQLENSNESAPSTAQNTNTENKPVDDKQLQALFSKIRQEEKDKLYPKLNQFKTELEKTEKEKQALMQALEELRGNKPAEAPTTDLNALLAKQREELDRKYGDLFNSQKSEFERIANELQQEKLRRMKSEVLLEYGQDGKIVKELVSGNSEAELAESAVLARKLYEKYEANWKAQIAEEMKNLPAENNQTQTTTPRAKKTVDPLAPPKADGLITQPSLEQNNSAPTDHLEAMKNMTPSERRDYQIKHRDKIKDSLRKSFNSMAV